MALKPDRHTHQSSPLFAANMYTYIRIVYTHGHINCIHICIDMEVYIQTIHYYTQHTYIHTYIHTYTHMHT